MSVSATTTAASSTPRRDTSPLSSDPLGPPLPPPPRELTRDAEKLLKKLGFQVGRVDGHYSPATEAAVKQFQRAVGLDPTGGLDARTLSKMRAAAKHKKDGVESPGQKSAAVKRNESRLKRLGYDPGRVDGVYDQKTAGAMKAFKNDDHIGNPHGNRPRTGLASKSTQKKLAHDEKQLHHVPYRVRVKPSAQRRADDRGVERAIDARGSLKEGAHGKAVATLQRTLKRAGFDPKSDNGKFDERTAGMVKEFQRKSDLPATGEVNARTWRKLRGTTMETRSPTSPKQAIGEVNSHAVKETESKLKKLGFHPGKIDGDYTKQTEKAADAFRRKHHMRARDGVDGSTLKKIRKAYKKKMRPNLNTVAGCAKFLLNSPNVSFWPGLSTGSDRKNMERLARGQPAIVSTPDPVGDRTVKPPLALMRALVDMAKQRPFTITALTGGDHSSFSKHYRGLAVDVNPGAPVGRVGRYGGGVYNEGDHLHLYWGPGGP